MLHVFFLNSNHGKINLTLFKITCNYVDKKEYGLFTSPLKSILSF